MLDSLIELICQIWKGDSEIRDHPTIGESELDRRSRRLVAWLCGGAIGLLLILGLLLGWKFG
jgi:hypothetical protein